VDHPDTLDDLDVAMDVVSAAGLWADHEPYEADG
jgi:hypothetical protein